MEALDDLIKENLVELTLALEEEDSFRRLGRRAEARGLGISMEFAVELSVLAATRARIQAEGVMLRQFRADLAVIR